MRIEKPVCKILGLQQTRNGEKIGRFDIHAETHSSRHVDQKLCELIQTMILAFISNSCKTAPKSIIAKLYIMILQRTIILH
jgi:hypothetical protein